MSIEMIRVRKDAVDEALKYLTEYAQELANETRTASENQKSWNIQKTMSLLQQTRASSNMIVGVVWCPTCKGTGALEELAEVMERYDVVLKKPLRCKRCDAKGFLAIQTDGLVLETR